MKDIIRIRGLGLEGIVGNEESEGEGTIAPSLGNSGSMSGDKDGDNNGGWGKNAGAAEIVDNFSCVFEAVIKGEK